MEGGEEGGVLVGAADGDAQRVGQVRRGKAADQDALFGQGVGQFATGEILEAAENKVGLAGQWFHARQSGQRLPQPLPLGHQAGDGVLDVGHVLKGGQRGHDGCSVDVVGRSQPGHGRGDLGRGHRIAQPQPGHARPLAEGAQHQQVGMVSQQRDDGLPAEFDIGLVDDDGQGQPQQALDGLNGDRSPVGIARRGDKEQFGLGAWFAAL